MARRCVGLALAVVSACAAFASSAQAQAPSEPVGVATWYGEDFDGKTTASGERFDMYQLTAAHPSLPLGALVEVTDLENGRKVVVRINDRRAPAPGGVIVLSKAAAANLGFVRDLKAMVRVRLLQSAADPEATSWRQASAR